MRWLVLAAVGCAQAAPRVPADVLPYDDGFVASNQKFKATLARDGIELDTTPVLHTCDDIIPDRECAKCEVATVLDRIPPELIDEVALAFARYPTSVRKAARLEHVAFCKRITYEGDEIHGPAGLADPQAHRVYIGVDAFLGAGPGVSIQTVVHHEMFHLLDYAVLGAQEELVEREWRTLNPTNFAYKKDAVYVARPTGFVNSYATTNEQEDRASTFEFLMMRPLALCEMAKTDPAVARKARMVWQKVLRVEGAKRLAIEAKCLAAPKGKPLRNTKQRPAKGYDFRLKG